MKKSLIKAKVNGVEQDIAFDTTKLFNVVEEKLSNYVDDKYTNEDITEQLWHDMEDVLGENVTMEFRVSNIKQMTSHGCDYALFDMEAFIRLTNPKTGNEIIIRHEAKDFEYEGVIYDPMRYYGLSWKDFM